MHPGSKACSILSPIVETVKSEMVGQERACTGATHVPGTWNVLQLIVISWMGTSRLEGIKQSRGLMAGERPPGEGVGDAEPRNSYVAHGDPSPDP
ncbi:unnamed protein product [Boreogadus saida]